MNREIKNIILNMAECGECCLDALIDEYKQFNEYEIRNIFEQLLAEKLIEIEFYDEGYCPFHLTEKAIEYMLQETNKNFDEMMPICEKCGKKITICGHLTSELEEEIILKNCMEKK